MTFPYLASIARAAAGAALVLTAFAAQADWAADWKQTIGEVWSQTKVKTQEYLDPQKYRPTKPVDLGVAYGTEKEKWLEWAVAEFAKTEAGKSIKINLIPMGSVDGAKAVLGQDKRIHVWSPASSLVQALLSEPWEREHGASPILSDAPLALTPMVYVMWEDRHKAFAAKYGDLNWKGASSPSVTPSRAPRTAGSCRWC